VLLWSGQTVSSLGTAVAAVAYPLLALAATGSAVQAGLVGAVGSAAMLCGTLPAGVWADRHPPRALIVGCHLLRAVVSAMLVVAVLAHRADLGLLMAASATMGFVGPTAFATESIAIRRIVPPEQLAGALAQNDARSHIANLLGQPVGGYLYALAAWAPILADGVSFLFAAASAAAVRTPLKLRTPLDSTAPPGEREPMRRQIVAGLRHTWHTRFLRVTLLCCAGINVAFSGLTFAVIASHAHAGAGGLGLALGIGSVGGLVGAWASPRLLRMFRPRTVIVGFGWIVTAALLGLGVVDTVTAVGGLLAVMYLLAAPANGVLFAAQIHITPPDMQGRVVSAMLTLFGISAPVGPLLAGVLIARSGQLLAFACLAALVAACTLTLQYSRAVRGMPDDLSQPAEPSDSPDDTQTTTDSAPQASSPGAH